jgi:hypothetical protein
MTDRVLPSEEIANSIIELRRDTPLAADGRELGRFVLLCRAINSRSRSWSGRVRPGRSKALSTRWPNGMRRTRERWSAGRGLGWSEIPKRRSVGPKVLCGEFSRPAG